MVERRERRAESWTRGCRGQATVEHALLTGAFVAALVGMSVYLTRGLQGAVKTGADQIGAQKDGLMDIDFKLNWKVKGFSNMAGTSVSHLNTDTQPNGAVDVTNVDLQTNNSGIASFAVFTDPNQ